jgi:membrane protease YdiL (CAAX protease family)
MTKSLSRWFVLDGRLRSGWRVMLYLICYGIALLLVQIPILVLYIVLLVWRGAASMADIVAQLQTDQLPAWLYGALKLGEFAMLVPLTVLFCRFLDRRKWVTLGFRWERGRLLDVALGVVLGGLQMALIFGVAWGIRSLDVSLLSGSALLRALVDGLVLTGMFVLVAVGEELMFRGYLQTNLGEGMGPWPALLLTSVLFGLFHGLNPNLGWLALVNIALAGLSMGYGRMVSGALWLPMAYHWSWNWFQGVVFALPVSGVRFGGLLHVVDPGNAPLLTGGAFGPEGGLMATVALLLSFPLFWWWGRRRG